MIFQEALQYIEEAPIMNLRDAQAKIRETQKKIKKAPSFSGAGLRKAGAVVAGIKAPAMKK